MKKLWLLRPIRGLEPDPWSPWFDKCFGQVVRAESEDRARKIAVGVNYELGGPGDEGSGVWLDPDKTTCVELTGDGPEERIMSDFAAS